MRNYLKEAHSGIHVVPSPPYHTGSHQAQGTPWLGADPWLSGCLPQPPSMVRSGNMYSRNAGGGAASMSE